MVPEPVDFHVAPLHPGLGHLVTCDDLKRDYGDWWSVRTVEVNRGLAKADLPVYPTWHEQAVYHETAEDDEDICKRMHKGRRALYQQGLNETGPYQSPPEDGMMHFHAFLRWEIEPHLK